MVMTPLHGGSTLDVRNTYLPVIRPMKTDFDPLDHRAPLTPIRVWMAYFNLLRTMCGAGILGMPLAISQAGIILGPVLCVCTGVLLIHTHLLLLRCLNEISRQLKIPYISYRYGFRLALLHGPPIIHGMGNHGPKIIATFMFMSQLGICTVFVIFTSDSLRDLLDWQSSRPALLVLIFPYILLEYFMKSLRVVSYVSMFGDFTFFLTTIPLSALPMEAEQQFANNAMKLDLAATVLGMSNLLNVVGLVVIFIDILADPVRETIPVSNSVMQFLFAFGTFMFNLSAVGVILSMDKALKDARKMISRFGVIKVGIFIPTVISALFGSFGYWGFGAMDENILRSLPFDQATTAVSESFFLLSVAFSYPIQCYPAIAVVIEVIKYHDPVTTPSEKGLKWVELLARPLFVTLTFILCYFIPVQGPFVAFVGNLCTAQMSVVFPALMDICLRYPHYYGRFKFILIKDLIILLIGLTATVFGVYFCGYLIYIRVRAMYSPSNIGYF